MLIPPSCFAINWPILMADMMKAYIVPKMIVDQKKKPSIFAGHILQANIRIGKVFNSATICSKTVSKIEKTVSGIPN